MGVKEGKAKFVKTRIIRFRNKHRAGLHNWVKGVKSKACQEGFEG